MAERKQDLLGNVIGRITELPGAKGLIDSMHTLRERTDDMQKRIRGLEGLEKKVKDLEKRVKALESGGARPGSTARKTTATKATTASRRRTPRTTPGSGSTG
jgi:TolA-binding protein